MSDALPLRLILEVPADDVALRLYSQAALERRDQALKGWLIENGWAPAADFEITDLPTLSVAFEAGDDLKAEGSRLAIGPPRRLVIGVTLRNDAALRAFEDLERRRDDGAVSTDVAVAAFTSWCPPASPPAFFQTRTEALRLIRAEALAPELDGQDVNVLVIDDGLSRNRLRSLFPSLAFGGGFRVTQPGYPIRKPGQAQPESHGTNVCRNLLALAPRARIFDLPLLPDRIVAVSSYMVWAHGIFRRATDAIQDWLERHVLTGPWVFCNAWGIYDRRTEVVPGSYTAGPNHVFNRLVARLDQAGWVDQVFACGNCGMHCPSGRCGPHDRGPGESILGANSHGSVLSVGATRTDALRLGYSSQGPGQRAFLGANPPLEALMKKPDLCVPSQFAEPADAFTVHTGTSTACGLASGAIAALRSGYRDPTPDELRTSLRKSARQSPGSGWNPDLGYGVLDLEGAMLLLGTPSP